MNDIIIETNEQIHESQHLERGNSDC